MWGDRFEVIVSTHLNTKHYHNHFVINSVSFKDGKRYYDKRETYARLRQLSDSLCEEYGLSVLKEIIIILLQKKILIEPLHKHIHIRILNA